jgi:hypothetical protein
MAEPPAVDPTTGRPLTTTSPSQAVGRARRDGERVCREAEIVAIVCYACGSRGAAYACATCGDLLCGKCKEEH